MSLTDQQFNAVIATARATNRRRDEIEHAAGLAAPGEGDQAMALRTVVCALEAGLRTQDWDCIAEALVMLADTSDYHPWGARDNSGNVS